MKAKMWNKTEWITSTDSEFLRCTLNELLDEAGFTVLKINDHYFTPFGYTALWLLSESHLAIHTFPEENKTYVELSSCVKEPFEKFSNLFDKKFSTLVAR